MTSFPINRVWAMPSRNTFSIGPIKEIIDRYVNGVSIDPFANTSRVASITNDLNPEFETDHHLDALDFLKMFNEETVDTVLYDPPYSVRQVSECYRGVGIPVGKEITRSSFWTNIKREISRVVVKKGIVITCGWNSGGIGKTLGFEIVEILLVPHGGIHNDTIVVVERKRQIGEVA